MATMKLWKWVLLFLFVGGLLYSKDGEKKNPERGADSTSKTSAQGCCRIKMTGGGYDYFVATEEECASHKQFHSFLKERTLCFESFPE
ncbi:LIC_11321 family protein [Leptospira ainlahdjerensis]